MWTHRPSSLSREASGPRGECTLDVSLDSLLDRLSFPFKSPPHRNGIFPVIWKAFRSIPSIDQPLIPERISRLSRPVVDHHKSLPRGNRDNGKGEEHFKEGPDDGGIIRNDPEGLWERRVQRQESVEDEHEE